MSDNAPSPLSLRIYVATEYKLQVVLTKVKDDAKGLGTGNMP